MISIRKALILGTLAWGSGFVDPRPVQAGLLQLLLSAATVPVSTADPRPPGNPPGRPPISQPVPGTNLGG